MSNAVAAKPKPLNLEMPRSVKVFNILAKPFAKTAIKLDADKLLAEASRLTGLNDFGESDFEEPYRILLDSLDNEARLTILGRKIARDEVTQYLVNRLRIHDTLKNNPQIEEQPVTNPVFILGMPRTGTTILHDLLAEDRTSRVPMTWEVKLPFPPPEKSTYYSDPRIAEVEAQLQGVDKLIPDFKTMHPMSAMLPQECVAFSSQQFYSMQLTTQFHLPSYQDWLENKADPTVFYGYHKQELQYLQWKMPAARWVLKSPCHLWTMDALIDTYPDALIIQNHRDPLKVLSSITSLIRTLRSLCSAEVDAHEIALDWSAQFATALNSSVDWRERVKPESNRIFDVFFHDFMDDQAAMVRRIYEHFDFAYTADVETRVKQHLADHSQEKTGYHKHNFAMTGLDVEGERQRYKRYYDYFNMTPEDVS